MAYKVWLTDEATHDLSEILDSIATNRGATEAGYVIEQIERTFSSLDDSPERGTYPKELAVLGIREYHEVFLKPYLIIYRIVAKDVFVVLVADGRRDFQALLQRRLLQG